MYGYATVRILRQSTAPLLRVLGILHFVSLYDFTMNEHSVPGDD